MLHNRRPETEAQLLAWDKQHYWHAFTQMAEYEPLVIDSAKGVWLFDSHGRPLLDGAGSMWCNVHGHQHPIIDQAIRDQLERVAHVTSLGLSNPTAVRLAKRLVEITPNELECVFYSSDGACAVEVALKMAFQYWRQKPQPERQRSLFLAIGDSYHGDTLGSVSVGGVTRFHAMFDPLLFEVVRGLCPDTYRLPAGISSDELCSYYLDHYRDLFERFGDRLAAVIVEPLMQGAAGMVKHPEGFLGGLRKLADEYGTLLIADEIAMGMGRAGRMWASEWEEVVPDLLCTGKGLSGGYLPVAATITSREIWEAFLGEYAASKSFFHGHTFGGNPLGCAAALATIDIFEQEQTLANVEQQGRYLADKLETLRDLTHVGDVRSLGLAAGVELVADRQTQTGFNWADRRGHLACQAALKKGVWLRPIGNVIIMMPPLCVRQEHIDQLVEAVRYGVTVTSRA